MLRGSKTGEKRKKRKRRRKERNNHHHSFPISSQATSQTKKGLEFTQRETGEGAIHFWAIFQWRRPIWTFLRGRRQERRRRLKCLLRKTLTAGEKTAEEEEFLQRPFSGSREMDAGDLSVSLSLFLSKIKEKRKMPSALWAVWDLPNKQKNACS